MKYQVGDLLLVKHCEFKPRLPLLRHRLCDYLRLHLLPRLRVFPELFNSCGIITEAIKHSDAWEGETTSDENVYVWYSQIDSKEHFFYEDEVIGEVVK